MTSSGISNWPAPARLTVGVVSAGRVGSTVGAALEAAGHVVGGVVARSERSRARAARLLPDSEVLDLAAVVARSELLVVAVPDDALSGVVDDIATTRALRPGTLVAHTAGAQGIGIFAVGHRLFALGKQAIAIGLALAGVFLRFRRGGGS